VPKFGFKNINRKEFKAVNLSTLEALAEAKNLTTITVEDLRVAGLVSKNKPVKVLGNGAITRAIEVVADSFSKAAEDAIVAAGGKATKISK
jgi:large subunit ribosomal protein L15